MGIPTVMVSMDIPTVMAITAIHMVGMDILMPHQREQTNYGKKIQRTLLKCGTTRLLLVLNMEDREA